MTSTTKPLSQKTLYRFHVENLREIDTAIERLARAMREAIGKKDNVTLKSFLKLYCFMLGAWTECRLQKLLYEPNGFDDSERSLIRKKDSQLDFWLATVETAYRKHYNIPKANLDIHSLKHSEYSRYESLVNLLNNDLRLIIELRNKLAHAQWIHPLSNTGATLSVEVLNVFKTENLLSLQFKRQLIEQIAEIIHDLVVSRPTFERDFDKHFLIIANTKSQLEKRKYEDYERNLQVKYKKGKQKGI